VVKTELSSKINQEKLLEVLKRNAVHDYIDFGDISNLIDFIIKPESGAITAQTIYLGGV